jgi:hypothetical protein
MWYDKHKVLDIIEKLQIIMEYDYICFCNEDADKVVEIIEKIDNEVDKLVELQKDNYSN